MTKKEIRYTGLRPGEYHLLWEVVGHEADASTCRVCGTKFGEWRKKIVEQGGATQAECCKGFELRKTDEGRS